MFRLIQNVVLEVKLSSSVMAGCNSTATLDFQISALFELSSRPPRQVPSFPSEVCWFAPRIVVPRLWCEFPGRFCPNHWACFCFFG